MSLATYAQTAFALALVLALIGLAALAARRFGLSAMPRLSGRAKRLAVLEVLAVDPRTRLLLVRQDDKEHLLLVGPQAALLVASGPAATEAGGMPDEGSGGGGK